MNYVYEDHEWKHYYEDGRWKKESIEEHRDRTETSADKIAQLRELYDLHCELDGETEGWGKIKEQTRVRLKTALQADNWDHTEEIEELSDS